MSKPVVFKPCPICKRLPFEGCRHTAAQKARARLWARRRNPKSKIQNQERHDR